MSPETSYPREKIKVLLLEGISTSASKLFSKNGYTVQTEAKALSEDELIRRINSVHILGIRSKTKVTEKVLKNAPLLLSIGCFCIGTDQVKLASAQINGVPVFNAPFSNTRSVAELTLGNIIMLARRAAHKSNLLHAGVWEKSADGCVEVRHKTLGIIGYGHIGPQIGLLAEALGMKVIFYDIAPKLPLGNAARTSSLKEVLKNSDFVTLHVPDTKDTKGMIGKKEIALMKKGSYLINLARGKVVDIDALASALENGHLSGAAVDVFPHEPASNNEKFTSPLCGLSNVILTPHIGGSTLEAQTNIGTEVAESLLKYIETGSTTGAVNFPNVDLPYVDGSHRILNIHQNIPGALKSINEIISESGINIASQYLSTLGDVGYLIMDVEKGVTKSVKKKIDKLDFSIRTRVLF